MSCFFFTFEVLKIKYNGKRRQKNKKRQDLQRFFRQVKTSEDQEGNCSEGELIGMQVEGVEGVEVVEGCLQPLQLIYGANLTILQTFPSLMYFILSCNRLLRPCQNSMLSGTTLYPPQCDGLGITAP